MKKVLFVFMLLFYFNGFVFNAEEREIFSWGEFNIKVELGEDLQIVLRKIKTEIKLKEGYTDPEFYVLNNYVNYTTQSTINTNCINVYRLDHKAVSPKYNKSEIRSYYLHIVDTTPPEILSSTSFKISYGQSETDYLKGLVVTDNYTKKEDIEIIVDTSNINYQKIGIYEILYIISDCSGNKLFHTEKLEIVDLIKPTITKIKDLVYQVASDFSLDDYFEITDNYDSNPVIKFEIIGDKNTLGTKEIIITATDQSGNKTIFKDMLEIVDTISPLICLEKQIVEVNIGEEIDLFDLVLVSDNYDEVTDFDLIITSNINFDLVGSYEVIYELTDSSNNKTTEHLTVLVRDLIPPVIHADDLTIKKGETKNFLLYAKVTDNLSDRSKISLNVIYNDVDFNKPGIYHVTFEAVDEYGNHADKTIKVTILGSTNEQKIFYFLLIGGAATFIVGSIIIVIKKRKKLY